MGVEILEKLLLRPWRIFKVIEKLLLRPWRIFKVRFDVDGRVETCKFVCTAFYPLH